MITEIRKERPYWSNVPHDREVLSIHFPEIPANNTQGHFIWVPKWADIIKIYGYAREVEASSWRNKDAKILKYPIPQLDTSGVRQSPAACGVGGVRGAQQCAPAQQGD